MFCLCVGLVRLESSEISVPFSPTHVMLEVHDASSEGNLDSQNSVLTEMNIVCGHGVEGCSRR